MRAFSIFFFLSLFSAELLRADVLDLTNCPHPEAVQGLRKNFKPVDDLFVPWREYQRSLGQGMISWEGNEENGDACRRRYQQRVKEDLKSIEKRFFETIDEMNSGRDEKGVPIGGQRHAGCSVVSAGINNLISNTRRNQMVCVDQALYVQRKLGAFLADNCGSRMNVGWGVAHYGTDGVLGGVTGEMETTTAAFMRAVRFGDLMPHQRSVVYDERMENFYWVDSWTCRFEPLSESEKTLFQAYHERQARTSNPSATYGDSLRSKIACKKKKSFADSLADAEKARNSGRRYCPYDDP